MKKKVWIVCEDEQWKDDILNAFDNTPTCPPPYKGKPCPLNESGAVKSCRECWLDLIDIEVAENN